MPDCLDIWNGQKNVCEYYIINFANYQIVEEHTKKTISLCEKKGKWCGISQLMSLCALLHDMGKNKQIFTDYLQADESTKKKLKGTIAHASTGAKYIYDKYPEESGDMKYIIEMILYTIAAHHGLFDCVDIEHRDLFSKRLSQVEDYEEAFQNAKRDYLDEYELDRIFEEASEEFHLIWKKIKEIWIKLKPLLIDKFHRKAKGMLVDCKLFLLACLQRLMLSILIDSDWEATSDFMNHVDTLSKQSEVTPQEIFEKAGENFLKYMEKKEGIYRQFKINREREEHI